MPVAAMGVWQYKPDEAEAAIKLALQVPISTQKIINESKLKSNSIPGRVYSHRHCQ